jgi:hypothetical protein
MSFAAAPKLYAMEYYYTLERGTNLASHPIHVSKKTEALGFGFDGVGGDRVAAGSRSFSRCHEEIDALCSSSLSQACLHLPSPISSSAVSLSQACLLSYLLPLSLSLSCPWLLAPSRLSPPPLSARSSLSPSSCPPPSLFATVGARRPPAALGAAASDTGEQANGYGSPSSPPSIPLPSRY